MAEENQGTPEPATTMTETTPTPEGASPEGAGGEGDKEEKLRQTVDITDVGPCRKRIKVAIDRGDVDKRVEEKYKELVGDSWIPGFRPGKAPKQIVIRKFKKEVNDQVKGQLLLTSLEQLAEDFDVAPLSPPNLNPGQLDIPDQGPFIYEFEVEVRPQFDLPDYKGLKLKRPTRTFSDDDVRKESQRILANFGQLIPKDGPAEKGDYLIADMTTKFADQVIGTANEITLRIDDTVTFKDGVASKFAEQTVGAKAGDTRTVDITMTDGVADENLRGKTVQATLNVKDVKSLRLPELTEEFLQENFGVRTEDALRERVRTMLERRLEYQQRQSAREQVLGQIASAANWDLPQDLLMRQARKTFARRVMEMREAGLGDEEIQSRQRLLERDVLNSTASALKEHFVLQKIAEVEKIEIDEAEIEAEIEAIADQTGDSARRVRAQFEREDLIETLAAQLIERKALNLILDSAQYEDQPIGQEATLSSVEQQAVPGEMKDPTAAPPEQTGEGEQKV
jgi:trigger factor